MSLRANQRVSLSQGAEATHPTSFLESDIGPILNKDQGQDSILLSLAAFEGNDLPLLPYCWLRNDAYWPFDQIKPVDSPIGPTSWLEDISDGTLTSVLGLLAEFEGNQQRDQFSASFEKTITECGQKDSIGHAVTLYLSGHKLELTFQLLQICVKLASNNLLPDRAADNLVQWLFTTGLSQNVDQFLDLNIPTIDAFKSQMLISASRLGLPGLVRALIAKGADLHARDGSWGDRSPLGKAIQHDRRHVVELLLDAGACPETTEALGSRSPLYSAIAQEHDVCIVELLIKHGADVNTRPQDCHSVLHQAIKAGKSALVEILLKAGADVNVEFWYASHELARQESALQCALRVDDMDIAQLLIDHGADVNSCNNNFGHVYSIDDDGFSSDEDADLSELDIAYDESYLTPIQTACLYSRPQAVRMLLEAGADINLCPWKDVINDICRESESFISTFATVLQAAVLKADTVLVCDLLQAGAHVNDNGCPLTALQLAASRSDFNMTRLLLEKGANVND